MPFILAVFVVGVAAPIAFVLKVVQPLIESLLSTTIDGDQRTPEEVEQLGASFAHWRLNKFE